jgi:hypothetical protein
MNYVNMVAPDGSQQKLVPAVPEEIVPWMVLGWRQVDAPAPPAPPPKEEQE